MQRLNLFLGITIIVMAGIIACLLIQKHYDTQSVSAFFNHFIQEDNVYPVRDLDIPLINYQHGIALVSYHSAPEVINYVTVDFKRDSILRTRFDRHMGGEFIPEFIFDDHTLIAIQWDDGVDEEKLVATDLEGNIIKEIQVFPGGVTNPVEVAIEDGGRFVIYGVDGAYTLNSDLTLQHRIN